MFFSLPCWETTATLAAPVGHTLRFAASLVTTATAAMLLAHVGPALFAARFRGPWPPVTWVLAAWLSGGYLEWLGTLAYTEFEVSDMPNVWSMYCIVVVFLVLATALAWLKSWWKGAVIVALLLSMGILTWSLAMEWQLVASQMIGKRLTWDEVAGKNHEPHTYPN